MEEEKNQEMRSVSPKDKGILTLLAWLLGSLGVDRFYRGQIELGILKLITFGGCGIWALVDTILYTVGSLPLDANRKIIVDKKTLESILIKRGAEQHDARIEISQKDRGVLTLLGILLGQFGIDRFYRGQIGFGILKLITFGGCGIWALVDNILYMVGRPPADADGRLIADRRTMEFFR